MSELFKTKKPGMKSKKPSTAELDFMYANMTAREIAEHYKVSIPTVRRWIREERNKLKETEKK